VFNDPYDPLCSVILCDPYDPLCSMILVILITYDPLCSMILVIFITYDPLCSIILMILCVQWSFVIHIILCGQLTLWSFVFNALVIFCDPYDPLCSMIPWFCCVQWQSMGHQTAKGTFSSCTTHNHASCTSYTHTLTPTVLHPEHSYNMFARYTFLLPHSYINIRTACTCLYILPRT
jgi:hypothetical protein